MKNYLRVLFLILLCIKASIALADYFVVDGIYYNLIDGGVEVTHGGFDVYGAPRPVYGGVVTIPEFIRYQDEIYSVKRIDEFAFCSCRDLTTVIIPNSVRLIGRSAFASSGLTSIIIPFGTSLGGDAFAYCENLTSITFNCDLDAGVFSDCNSLTDIYCPRESPPQVHWNRFEDFNVESATLHVPAGSVDKYRRTSPWNRFGSIVAINSGPNIAFADNDVKAKCVTYWDTNGDSKINKAEAEAVTTLGTVFESNQSITSFNELKHFSRLTYIANAAFRTCRSLTSISIPESVTSIGTEAFYACKLTDFSCYASTVPETNNEFHGVFGTGYTGRPIEEATLYVPAASLSKYSQKEPWKNFGSIVAIGEIPVTGIALNHTTLSFNAVNETAALIASVTPSNATNKSVAWTSSNSSIATVSDTGLVTSKANGTAIITAKTKDGSNLTATCIVTVSFDNDFFITFADSNVKDICVANWDANGDGELSEEEASKVTNLGEVFKGNTNITSFDELQYFTGLTSIDSYAFEACHGLTSICIPENVTSIDGSAFSKCSSLTSITIDSAITSIGCYAFSDCSSLTYIDIPESVTSISYSVFGGCSSLTSVTIPNGVTSIESYTFCNCSSLTSITIPDSVTDIGYCAFSDCSNLISLSIGSGVTNIDSYAFLRCSSLTSITIPNNVTSIDYNAFSDCSNLISLSIGSGVTNIGSYAFSGCTGLKEVHCYAENIPTTDNTAFGGVNMTNSRLYVPASSKEAYRRTSPWSDFGMILAIGDIPATGISLNRTILSFNAANETATLIASVTPSNATNKSVTWTTSNSSVATVSDTGVVTSKADGTATITATTADGTNLSASCEVIVSIPVLATGISLNQTTLSFNALNQTATLTATVTPSNAANKNVIWTSSDVSVATVNDTGLVTAKGNGAATITAKTTDGSNLTATCNVTVYEATRINIAISYAGYSTFYDSHCNYILPNGLSAQVVTNVSNNKLIYKTIADGNNAGVVPMGTAVILVSDEKRSKAFTLTSTGNNASYSGANLLHGSDETTVTMGEGYHYKLSYGPTGTGWDKVFGWYWGAQDGSPFQIEGHKAWLVVPSGSTRAEAFTIDGDATDIISIESEEEVCDVYYDMQGRRINTPANRGIYIKNGKKVVVK